MTVGERSQAVLLCAEMKESGMAEDIPYGVDVLVAKDGKFLCGMRSDSCELAGSGGQIIAGEDLKMASVREL